MERSMAFSMKRWAYCPSPMDSSHSVTPLIGTFIPPRSHCQQLEVECLLERAASALGQKQTYAAQKPMSALPPKADIWSAPTHVGFGQIADLSRFTQSSGQRAAALPGTLRCPMPSRF